MIESNRQTKGGKKKKPESMISYNNFMCGVDRIDQLMSCFSPLRKTQKWYRKVVFQLLDQAIVNAFTLYKKVGGTKAQLKFRKSVIASPLSSDIRINEDLSKTSNTAAFHHHKSFDLSRMSAQHYWLMSLQELQRKMLLNSALFAVIKSNEKKLATCVENMLLKTSFMCGSLLQKIP